MRSSPTFHLCRRSVQPFGPLVSPNKPSAVKAHTGHLHDTPYLHIISSHNSRPLILTTPHRRYHANLPRNHPYYQPPITENATNTHNQLPIPIPLPHPHRRHLHLRYRHPLRLPFHPSSVLPYHHHRSPNSRQPHHHRLHPHHHRRLSPRRPPRLLLPPTRGPERAQSSGPSCSCRGNRCRCQCRSWRGFSRGGSI